MDWKDPKVLIGGGLALFLVGVVIWYFFFRDDEAVLSTKPDLKRDEQAGDLGSGNANTQTGSTPVNPLPVNPSPAPVNPSPVVPNKAPCEFPIGYYVYCSRILEAQRKMNRCGANLKEDGQLGDFTAAEIDQRIGGGLLSFASSVKSRQKLTSSQYNQIMTLTCEAKPGGGGSGSSAPSQASTGSNNNCSYWDWAWNGFQCPHRFGGGQFGGAGADGGFG